MSYNSNNIFNKIVNKQISTNICAENNSFICVKDINPKANYHFLFISKHNIKDFNTSVNFDDLHSLILEVCTNNNIQDYQIITNVGSYQEIPHLHFHLLSNN